MRSERCTQLADTWEAVLDRLEAELAAVERELAAHGPQLESAVTSAQLATWVPPRGLGPLPEGLLGRARDLAAAQARLAERLDAIRLSVVHHLTALRATGAPAHRPPVFVDVQG